MEPEKIKQVLLILFTISQTIDIIIKGMALESGLSDEEVKQEWDKTNLLYKTASERFKH